MKITNLFKVVLPLILLSDAYGQQTFNKLNINELTLPKQEAGKVLVLDGDKKAVGATSVTSIELDNLSGSTENIQNALDQFGIDIFEIESNTNANTTDISTLQTEMDTAQADIDTAEAAIVTNDAAAVHKTGNETVAGEKTFTGKMIATSTSNGAIPCPVMTDAQMLAIASPSNGDCVYNSTKKGQYVYSSVDSKFKPNGGGAGGSRLNLLTDGSFEDGVSEGTCSGCTASQESVDVLATPNNEKALKLTFSASTGCYTVDKTTSATYSNTQGLVGAWIKNSSAGVTLTTRRNGADTLNVKTIDTNGIYTYHEIPDVTGSTSFGYKICATSSITGVIFADETFLGPSKVLANTSVIGPWTTGVCTSSHTTAVTTTCKYRQVGDSIEINFKNTYSGLTNAVNLTFGLPNGWTVDTSKLQGPAANFTPYLSTVSFLDSGVTLHPGYATYWDTSNIQIRYFNNAATATAVKSDNAVTNVLPATTSSGDTVDALVVVPITQFAASTNTLSSTNGNTSWASCGHTAADFTGFGTVTNIETQCKRDGDDLLMKGKFTSGTSTAVEARVALKHQGLSLTSASTPKIPSIQAAGFDQIGTTGGVAQAIGASRTILVEPSVGYFTYSSRSSTASGLTKLNGNSVASSGEVLSFNARIPISTWDNSNVIVASLKDTPTTIGSTGVDFQSVFFGSGTDCSSACTSGFCTICSQQGNRITSAEWISTSIIRLNGIDGKKYNCVGNGYGSTYIPLLHNKSASTTSYVGLEHATGNTAYNSVICTGIP